MSDRDAAKMGTYQLPMEPCRPLLFVRELPNQDVCFYSSLNSGCDLKKGGHGDDSRQLEGVLGLKAGLPGFELTRFEARVQKT
jgi:hypothetical protein